MRVNVYFDGNDVHDYCIGQFAKGIPREHSVTHKKLADHEPSDVAVMFGMYKRKVPISWPRGKILEQQTERGGITVVIDSGYINRGDGPNHHYSVGLNGLNGRAEFRNRGMGGDRVGKLDVTLKPWRTTGEYIVLCGQVPHDASVQHVNIFDWYGAVLREIPKHSKREVKFRPHPKAPFCPGGMGVSEDLDEAYCLVTYNSNMGVLGAIEGVPIFAFDKGSMALRVANTDLKYLENPYLPEREPWLNDLAYAQWQPKEMAEGQTWRHLLGFSSATTRDSR